MSLEQHLKIIDVSPASYAAAAVLAQEVAEQMLARLEWMSLQPRLIVDIGCGVGESALHLQKRYPTAQVVAVDVSYPMLTYAKQQAQSSVEFTHEPIQFVCADTSVLPFADHSVDMLFANLILPWCSDVDAVWREWRRVLKPEGLLLFSSLGPDTLQVWHEALAEVMLPDLIDMHHHGDALTRARFVDPVMDVEYVTLRYRSSEAMLAELFASGMIQEAGLHLDLACLSDPALWDATYEVVYGHAFGSAVRLEQSVDESGVVKFPLSHLRRRT